MTVPPPKDLIVLVADSNMKATVEALLVRTEALGIRPIEVDVFSHPRKDPGCRINSCGFLASFQRMYSFALVMFDHDGSGAESKPASQIEAELVEQLEISGWVQRCNVVVVVPELEAWVWSPSKRVDDICGWSGSIPSLRDWVADRFAIREDGKPQMPKESLEAALQEKRKVRSSALLREIAKSVSWRGCTDIAFQKFCQLLQNWFPSTVDSKD